ncbi:MAG: hypothetical protein WCK21_04415 [Actinomycetota bacterium]
MPAPVPPAGSQARLQRAADLRRLARQLQALQLLTAHQYAGDDTWVGPPAQRCRDRLLVHARVVTSHAEQLLVMARRLEWEAQP